MSVPNALVLGGGGVLGEAWMMGLLSGLEDGAGFDARRCEHFVGTSAGALVAAHLAAGIPPRRPLASAAGDAQDPLPGRRRARTSRLSTIVSLPLVLGLANPVGAAVRALLLRRLPEPHETLDGLRAQLVRTECAFDGRLRVVAVERLTGRRAVFGSSDAPPATVADAVTASCTVPWRFVPATIGGRQYVDGAVWSATNLDVVPGGDGTRVLCLNPIAALHGGGAVDMFRRLACAAAWLEARRLRRRGVTVQIVAPDLASTRAIGLKLMDRVRAEAVLRAGYDQGLALAQSRSEKPASLRPRPQTAAVVTSGVRSPATCPSIQASSSSQRS